MKYTMRSLHYDTCLKNMAKISKKCDIVRRSVYQDDIRLSTQ